MTPKDRLKRAQEVLGLPAYKLAEELKITPEWLSKIYRDKATVSEDIGLRLDQLLRTRGIDLASIESGSTLKVEEPPADYVKSRELTSGDAPDARNRVSPMLLDPRHAPKRGPSTQSDCETYFTELMKRAKQSNNPDAFPAIMARLKKSFPLNEWDETDE